MFGAWEKACRGHDPSSPAIAAFMIMFVLIACAGSSRHPPSPGNVIKTEITVQPEKKGLGRTPDEVFYQYSLPSDRWVQTNIAVLPNQEVIVHHFAFKDPLTVNLGGYHWTLNQPGTALPIMAVITCPTSDSVPVHYRCIELREPETIKLYRSKSKSPMKVGVLIKDRK
ncbi:MAG TPA: hypothetical protein VJU84_00680 [Pyrinomonadaceae bacterium]|nr:hypothetical protein [Pyrinomonadaceae bacterium]